MTTVLLERHPVPSDPRGIAVITLQRSQRANAYDASMLDALSEALDGMGEPRALVIRGAGAHFCSGADLNEMSGRALLDALHLASAALFDRVARLPCPTIAALQGAVLGGGLELALACDLRVASESAIFGFPETAIGLIPAAGGTFRLPSLIGIGRAKELIYTGRRIEAAEACRLGLVETVVPPAELMERALALAQDIARQDPLALQLAKTALDAHVPSYPAVAQALLYHRRREVSHA